MRVAATTGAVTEHMETSTRRQNKAFTSRTAVRKDEERKAQTKKEKGNRKQKTKKGKYKIEVKV